jgi:hypothetical protein
MPHIQLPEGLPGIRGPMAFSPETARPLNELANALLRTDDGFKPRRTRVDCHVRFLRKRLLFLPDDSRCRCQLLLGR